MQRGTVFLIRSTTCVCILWLIFFSFLFSRIKKQILISSFKSHFNDGKVTITKVWDYRRFSLHPYLCEFQLPFKTFPSTKMTKADQPVLPAPITSGHTAATGKTRPSGWPGLDYHRKRSPMLSPTPPTRAKQSLSRPESKPTQPIGW